MSNNKVRLSLYLSEKSKQFLSYSFAVFLYIFSLYINNLLLSTIVFYFFIITVIGFNAKKGIADPRVLLLGFMAIYFSFFPLRAYFFGTGILPYEEEKLKLLIQYQFFAVIVFVLMINLFVDEERISHRSDLFENSKKAHLSENLLLLIIVPIILISSVEVFSSGVTSKRELKDAGLILKRITDFVVILFISLAALRAARVRYWYSDPFLLFFIAISLFYVLLTGERDVLFRIVLIFLIISFDKKGGISLLTVLSLLILSVLIVPISQQFKGVVLTGELAFNRVGLDLILHNEFVSSSRNFYSLLVHGVDQSFNFLTNDIIRAFTPTIFLDDPNIVSAGSWFNNEYRVEHGFHGTSGWGFSIVGFGYLISGYSGIALIMTIYAFTLTFFYNRKNESVYLYVFYLLLYVTAIYVLRADLANFLSQSFKINGILMLVIFISHWLLKKRKANVVYKH